MGAAVSAPIKQQVSDRDRFVAFAFCWGDVLLELDAQHKVVFVTGATRPIFGKPVQEVLGKDFFSLVAEKDRPLADSLLLMTSNKGRVDNVHVRMDKGENVSAPIRLAGYVLPDLDNHHFLALRTNLHLDEEGGVEEGVSRDSTTGLYDTDSFSEMAAERLLSAKHGEEEAEITVLAVPGYDDLKNKLPMEDQESLKATIGTTLRAWSTGGDSAGSIGETKFGVVHEPGLDVVQLEQKIAAATKAFDPAGAGLDAQAGTLDLDLAEFSDDDLTRGLIYTINHIRDENADVDVKSLSSNMNKLVKDAAESLKNFRNVVKSNDFEIAFQPILDVNTGACHHHEALVRFGGKFQESPYKYIAFAEETGLISEFDIAMVRKVIEWLDENRDDDISIAVNISGSSIDNQRYNEQLHGLIDKRPWLCKHLLFEITESSTVANLALANNFIQGIRKKNFEVCLDDFGAGSASFQYLSTLEVDVVKLDGSAVKNSQLAPKGRAFMTALATLCRTMETKTIAEMVDTPESLEFVRDCGVDFVQGFLFAKPDPNPWAFLKGMDRRLFGRSV